MNPRDQRRAEQDQHDVRDVEPRDQAAKQGAHDRLVEFRSVREVDRGETGDDQGKALGDVQCPECCDEWRQPEPGDQDAVDEAHRAARQDAGDDPDRERQPHVGDDDAGHHGGERHHGPDREVDAAGDDDERLAQRQDADHRGRDQDPDDVVVLEELPGRDREEHDDQDQRAEGQESLDRPAADHRAEPGGSKRGVNHRPRPCPGPSSRHPHATAAGRCVA